MSKQSVFHRDGWTWELLRDAANRPSIDALLHQFTDLFTNEALPENLWTYLASALVYPFNKKLPEERTSTVDLAL
jgi:hypothetical protein